MANKKAYRKTRHNKLQLRLKRCEEPFRKLKALNKKALALLDLRPEPDYTLDVDEQLKFLNNVKSKVDKIKEQEEVYINEIRHFGICI